MGMRELRRARFGAVDLARLFLAVVAAAASIFVGLAAAELMDDPWMAGGMRVAAVAAALFAVLSFALRLFIETEHMKMLKEIRQAINENTTSTRELIRILAKYLPVMAVAMGAKVHPQDADAANKSSGDSGGNGGGSIDDNKPHTGGG